MKKLVAILAGILISAQIVCAQTASSRQSLFNAGTYSAGDTYHQSDVVSVSGAYYISLVNGNIGHTPASSPTQWSVLGSDTSIINAGISLSAAVTACGSANTTIQITQTIAVGSGITVPANCTLLYQSAGNLTGTSITINSQITAAPVQIFGSGLAVTGLTGTITPEWFGAISYSTRALAAAGTNSATAIQSAINATTFGTVHLTGWYRIGSALSITKSAVGITGDGVGYSYPSGTWQSGLVNTTAGTDSIDLAGVFGAEVQWNQFRRFAIERSVLPTGTATGFSCSYAGGTVVQNMQIEDNIHNIHAHRCPSEGTAGFNDVSVGWGYGAVTTYTTQTMDGVFADSVDGQPFLTLWLNGVTISANAANMGSAVTYGVRAEGTTLQDIDMYKIQTESASYGVALIADSGFTNGEDIHLDNYTLDACGISCIYVSGITFAKHSGFNIGEGYAYGLNTTSADVDIETSSGVSIGNCQCYTGAGAPALYVNGSININIANADFRNLDVGNTNPIVQINNSSAVTGSSVYMESNSTSTSYFLGFTNSSTYNSFTAATMQGNGVIGAYFDGTSAANDFTAAVIAPAIVTAVSGNPTGIPGYPSYFGPIISPSFTGAYSETLTTPSSSSAACVAGQFTDDANYHYVCTATNTWKRVALTTF